MRKSIKYFKKTIKAILEDTKTTSSLRKIFGDKENLMILQGRRQALGKG